MPNSAVPLQAGDFFKGTAWLYLFVQEDGEE